jgi:signal peptidase I
VRKTGLLILMLLTVASCGTTGSTGDKRYQVPNVAMEPTLKKGSTATAKTVKPGNYQPVDGDLVVVRPPASWGLTGPGELIIRRVVGVGGETIKYCEGPHGQLTRNGKPLDEPYLSPQGQTYFSDPVKVPAGQIYLMEDNRGMGLDSAAKGTVPVDAVVGVVDLG